MESIGVSGYVAPEFGPVKDAFQENFNDGWESAGAAFAVYHKGRLVVDVWGGYADTDTKRPWASDTMNMLFSCTKTTAMLSLATLVDRGLVSYADKVTKYWPEYGQNGKENTTISMVLLHQAGLPYVDRAVSMEDVRDPERMSRLLEEQTPVWTPGTQTGYHAITSGFLVDQLCRRIDPQHRGIPQYFKEHICAPNGLSDIYIGLPRALNARVSNVQMYTDEDVASETATNPLVGKELASAMEIYRQFPANFRSWISSLLAFNDAEVRSLEMPAANGVGTARCLAAAHSLLAEGKLLSDHTLLQMLHTPLLVDVLDVVNGYPENKGYGFQYTRNPQGDWILGHSGMGGQNVRADFDNQLAFAYLCNGLKAGDSDNVRTFARLKAALYNCL